MPAPGRAFRNDSPRQPIVKTPRRKVSNDTFEMTNLYPRDTGLPMTVWISPRGRALHDARVKVCMTPGDRMAATNTAVVAIRPEPRLLRGALAPRNFAPVAHWISLNAEALIAYWEGRLSTVDFAVRMQKVEAEPL